MSADTWNFQTWFCRDQGPGVSPRAWIGSGFKFGSTDLPLPFTNSITGIFSFFLRTNFVASGGETMFLTSIGKRSASPAFAAMGIFLNIFTSGNSTLALQFYDHGNSVLRYDYRIGDEDGVWLKMLKWYQVVFTADSSSLRISVNGKLNPIITAITHVPGPLNIDQGTERWWHLSPSAARNGITPVNTNNQWPSFIVGPSAWHTGTLDLTDQNVLDQIFDSDGDFRNPGQNGKLWWGADGLTAPLFYFVDGGVRFQQGSDSTAWIGHSSGGATSCPGGLRKEYEVSP